MRPSELCGENAHGSRRTEDQHPLAALKVGRVDELLGSESANGHGCSLGRRKLRWPWSDEIRGGGDLLGEGSDAREELRAVSEHRVTLGEMGDFRAHRGDRSGEVPAEDLGWCPRAHQLGALPYKTGFDSAQRPT